MTIEPTPEQFAGWLESALAQYREDWGDNPAFRSAGPKIGIVAGEVARLAYAAGADAKLEQCCEVLTEQYYGSAAAILRKAISPKKPTLEEQALEVFQRRRPEIQYYRNSEGFEEEMSPDLYTDMALIERALLSIPEQND